MVLTPSTMASLGSLAPDFNLIDVVSGQPITLDSFTDRKGLLVMFICNHCPFVVHIKTQLAQLGQDYIDQGLGIVAISANDIKTHPDDNPSHLKAMAEEFQFNFPMCFDPTQEVAKSYTAACTPDFFLFDHHRRLVYRGQLDDSRPSNNLPVTGTDLRAAIDNLLAGKKIDPNQKPSIGCNIKWTPGQEPPYFGVGTV
ncbi:MAG: thioredoxin family protein [Synechococcaceae cyanobacterium RL_1_2]|nr:thioredoxin family protein [Synechococcaceae cyanobacterium RL_1_2]